MPFAQRVFGAVQTEDFESRPTPQRCSAKSPYAELLDSIDIHGRLFGRDPLNQSLYLWNQTILVNTVLTYLGDRIEMASNSLA
jgi:hypothetical protein